MPVEMTAAARTPAIDARIELHAQARAIFLEWGLTSPEAFLNLPGEIVSGHPDRHVMRVELPDGRLCFLKKEHRVRWKDRFRNWRAGFGWSSKSVREGQTLRELERREIAAPRWLAFGEDNAGRAFLLVEAVADSVDLRRFVHSHHLTDEVAIQLGRYCAELHVAGVHHPDLCAKHVLVDSASGAFTLLDWQRAEIGDKVSWSRRIDALAGLAATLPATVRSRVQAKFLWAYCRVVRACREPLPTFAALARAIRKRVGSLERRRGIREQRQPPLDATSQRLVWVDGEALCAIPEIADELRSDETRRTLYDRSRNGVWKLESGQQAILRVSSYRALLRKTKWRAPELRLARLLFHLERYHIAAPRLLAFGQRRCGSRIEAFVLSDACSRSLLRLDDCLRQTDTMRRQILVDSLLETLRKLHEAGCELTSLDVLRVDAERGILLVAEPQNLRFRRHLSPRRRRTDCRRVTASMKPCCQDDALQRFAALLEEISAR